MKQTLLFKMVKLIAMGIQELFLSISRNPIVNLTGLFVTILAGANLLWTSLFQVQIDTGLFLNSLDRFYLFFFLLELLVRMAGSDSYYKKIYPWIDLLIILPLLSLFFRDLIPEDPEAGAVLLRSFRYLKFLFYYRLYSSYRVKGSNLIREHSPIKVKIFTGTAALLFLVIIFSGTVFAFLYSTTVALEKASRVTRISDYIKSHSPGETNETFSRYILKIKTESLSGNYEITNIDPDIVKNYYDYGVDYIQLDHVAPGISIQISFRDLHRKQNILEMGILILGLLVTAGLILSLNHFLEKLILDPVDRARRVMKLRISGEDITASFDRSTAHTEITSLIDDFDHMYRKLTRPGKQTTPD